MGLSPEAKRTRISDDDDMISAGSGDDKGTEKAPWDGDVSGANKPVVRRRELPGLVDEHLPLPPIGQNEAYARARGSGLRSLGYSFVDLSLGLSPQSHCLY